jgi:molecular chaperone DnaK (HSP70)
MLTDERIEEIINDPEDLKRIVRAIRELELKRGAAQAVDLFDEDELEEYSAKLDNAREAVISGIASDIETWVRQNQLDEVRQFVVTTFQLDKLTLAEIRDRFGSYLPDECPHGEPLGDCTACDVAGDLAYDAAREDRP